MKVKIISLFLFAATLVNIFYELESEAQPIVITVNTCLGRSQLDGDGNNRPLPDGGECFFNRYKGINEWYADEFANGREVYKKKHRIQKSMKYKKKSVSAGVCENLYVF